MTGNHEAQKFLDLSPDANISKSAEDAPPNYEVYSEGRALSAAELPMQRAAGAASAVAGAELEFRFDEGGRKYALGNALPLFGKFGEVRGAVGVFLDITARKQAEEALRESEARLSAVVEGALDAIVSIDSAGIVQSLNPAALKLFQYQAGEVTGQNVAMLMPEPYRSAHDGYLRHYLETGEARIIGSVREVMGQRKDGSCFPLELAVSKVSAGGRYLFVGVMHDITARKQAEQALRESEARFRSIFEHAGTGIAITDLQVRFQSCNPAYSRMLGYTEAELRALEFEALLHPEDRETNLAELGRLLAQEIPSFEIVNRFVAKDGRIIWVHKHISLLRDAAGAPAGIVALVTDMSERKRYEEQIHLLMREVNHRSKNLLTVVHSVARRTIASRPDDFIQRFGERIQALAASQDLLVANEWRGVDLADLVRSQLAHFKDLIGKRIALNGPELSISANAAQTLGMALHELATNAGKYGALSTVDGKVETGWGLERSGTGEPAFVMYWRERGGPEFPAPSRQGFGSTVISRMVMESLDAEVKLCYEAPGLSWSVRCPAAEVMDGYRRGEYRSNGGQRV